jgi:hypothetical protein
MALLHLYGGVWLDLETFALQDLEQPLRACSDDGQTVPGSQSVIGPLQPKTLFTRAWRHGVHSVLDDLFPNMTPTTSLDRLPRRDHISWEAILGLVWDNIALNLTMDKPSRYQNYGFSVPGDDPNSKANQLKACLQWCYYGREAAIKCHSAAGGALQFLDKRCVDKPFMVGMHSQLPTSVKEMNLSQFLESGTRLSRLAHEVLNSTLLPSVSHGLCVN